jgi:hypothetical protein
MLIHNERQNRAACNIFSCHTFLEVFKALGVQNVPMAVQMCVVKLLTFNAIHNAFSLVYEMHNFPYFTPYQAKMQVFFATILTFI